MRDAGFFLPGVAGEAGEVGIGEAGAVVALWMTGVIREDGDRLVVVPEADQLDLGVDRTGGERGDDGVFRRGPAGVEDFPVGSEDAAVGSHLLDDSASGSDVGYECCIGERFFHSFGCAVDDVAGERGVKADVGEVVLSQKVVCVEVAAGGVVLMEGLMKPIMVIVILATTIITVVPSAVVAVIN